MVLYANKSFMTLLEIPTNKNFNNSDNDAAGIGSVGSLMGH
jgi:hypothetical protein